MIRVDLAPADAHAPHGVPEALGRRAHHLVETCLFPGDAVMLPRNLHTGALESHFAVAATDQPGMRSLCARIRSRLEACAELREARIQISVRGTQLDWSDEVRAKPDALADAARAIERSLQIDSHWE